MKNFLLLAAIVLESITSFALNPVVSPQIVVSIIQEEYTEITSDLLPQTVLSALSKTYPGATIDKAFVNQNKEYKLEISVGDQKATVFADANGNWIKK